MKSNRGVTVIELMIALLIFFLAMGAGLQAFIMGNRWAKSLSHRTSALNLARAKMEEVLSLDYSDVTVGTQTDYPLVDKAKISTDADNLSSTRQLTISQVGDHKEITVNVTWATLGRTYHEQLASAVYP